MPAGALASERWAGLADITFQRAGADKEEARSLAENALAEDGDGFIWVGSSGGLSRWDGYQFHNYFVNPGERGGLPDGFVDVLHTDPSGRLWIGTHGGGLARYDRDHDRFIAYRAGPLGLSSDRVWSIADDGAGGLWVGTAGGLDHLDPETGRITTLHHDANDPGSLPSNNVLVLLHDDRGVLWVGTDVGVARLTPQTDRFAAIPLPIRMDESEAIFSLFEDVEGQLWIGTRTHGAFVIDPATGTSNPIVDTDGSPPSRDWVKSIAATGPNQIWLGTLGTGLVMVDRATHQTHRIQYDPMRPSSLADDTVQSLLRDRAGSLWVGTAAGLQRLNPAGDAVLSLFAISSRKDGLSSNGINRIVVSADQRVWAALGRDGVDVLDPGAARVASLKPDSSKPETALPEDHITAMVETEDAVYIGTLSGLYAANPRDMSVHRVVLPQRPANLPISALLADGPTLWVADRVAGLSSLSVGVGPKPAHDHLPVGRLTDRLVKTMLKGPDGALWIGTSNGLNRWDPATDAVEQIRSAPGDPSALPAGLVSTAMIDRRGRVWVGTTAGLAVMTERDSNGQPRFRLLGHSDGLVGNEISQLSEDAAGRVWVATARGLAIVDPDSFAIRPLNRADGVALDIFNPGGGAVTAAGEILFGGDTGLTVARPDRLSDWQYRPPVVVTEANIDGHPVPAGRFNHAGPVEPLILTPQTNSLAVEYASLDFTAPELNRYAYRLDGFDTDWIETSARRRLAAYTNLPPGDYTLRLRGSNRVGVWDDAALEMPIHVQPAWYQTLWFKAVLAAGGCAAVTTLVQVRSASFRRRQRELEDVVAKRTAELQRANNQLFELATTDLLTGCTNRRRFLELSADHIALARRTGTPLSMLIVDLDHFKQINDTYGHPAGDEVLRKTAGAFRDHVRSTDVLGRIGGEEFGLLMPDTDLQGSHVLAERLRQAIATATIEIENHALKVTASAGLALLGPDESFDALYARADSALYAAKHGGRDRVAVATQDSVAAPSV